MGHWRGLTRNSRDNIVLKSSCLGVQIWAHRYTVIIATVTKWWILMYQTTEEPERVCVAGRSRLLPSQDSLVFISIYWKNSDICGIQIIPLLKSISKHVPNLFILWNLFIYILYLLKWIQSKLFIKLINLIYIWIEFIFFKSNYYISLITFKSTSLMGLQKFSCHGIIQSMFDL